MEETVHDALKSHEPPSTEMPPLTEAPKVLIVEDIISNPASIAYHDYLKQLAQYLVLPVNKSNAKDKNTNVDCGASQPFEIPVTSRGTPAVIEWVIISQQHFSHVF